MTLLRCMLVLSLALSSATPALAQRPPETNPTSRDERIVLEFDRSSPVGDQILLPVRTVLAFSQAEQSLGYGELHLTCKSNSDSQTGKCPTIGIAEIGQAHSAIPLRFVERRSGLRTDLVVDGWHERIHPDAACFPQLWEGDRRNLWSSGYGTCRLRKPTGTGVYLGIAADEMRKLVAGRWDATLELDIKTSLDGAAVGTLKFTFDLTITDHDKANIYFPASDNITPLVNLNVAYLPVPSPPHVEGGTSLDMCLYDGLGSQIPYLEVTIRDDGKDAPGRAPGMHSVWHHAGGRGDDSRLDYSITLDYGGVPLKMDNNVTQRLLGIDTTQLRLVVLPGMSQPVYCVPAPLKLTVPRVLASSKLAGYYEGRMIIEMVVPSSTP